MDAKSPLLAACFTYGAVLFTFQAQAQHLDHLDHHRDPEVRSVGDITRSDSIDILHTTIDLDLTQSDLGIISAKATLRMAPRVNGLSVLPLDLLQLTVDSTKVNGTSSSFGQSGEILQVQLGGSFGPSDTLNVEVFYHGDPVVDASGWGGFYTLSAYQYDLGVAFDAVPHSFGRSWFPCFDNFVERCTFDFYVRTAQNRAVFANGTLISHTDLGGGISESHWHFAEPIPSYLASVTSGGYVAVRDTFPSISGDAIPVILAARPLDTTDMKNSFVHLKDAFDTYEGWFGPYRWERVGYCLTSQGAMEHPTNISYPDGIADGTLQNETIMAHELSHHWFGDLITCHRAEEMYINEGFADFCAWLFTEHVYGRVAYDNEVRNEHHKLVAQVHLLDGGSYALNDIPQAITYGVHSYEKGADVARTLREYLGDSLFSAGLKRVLTNDAYSDMSSEELRDSLSTATGMDLHDFFNNWILQPGWAAFEVDSFHVQPNGNLFTTTVFVQQKLRFADAFYQNVPVNVTFQDVNGAQWTAPQPVLLSDANTTFNVDVPFSPVAVFLNDDQRIALASTIQYDTLVNVATVNLPRADMQLVVNVMPQPAPVRVEEFWVAADPETVEPFAYVVSPDRWWRVTGSFGAGSDVSGKISIDGRATSPNSFDPGLILDAGGVTFSEDSLVLLYRADAHSAWSVQPSTLSFLGSHSDGYARMTFTGLTAGDYTIGWHKSTTGIAARSISSTDWSVYPNPTDDRIHIEAPRGFDLKGARVQLIDTMGAVLQSEPVREMNFSIDVNAVAPQTVHVVLLPRRGAALDLGDVVIMH